MQEVVVTNLPPTWILWLGYFGLFLFGVGTIIIAAVVAKLAGQVSRTLNEMHEIIERDVHRDIMPNVTAITKNIKTISDDAAETTHNVTGTVNRVSHVVSSVTTRLESPAIKAAGILSGVLAGARTMRGSKGKDNDDKKKRGGVFGLGKK
jgi:prophage DNA circulation protein